MLYYFYSTKNLEIKFGKHINIKKEIKPNLYYLHLLFIGFNSSKKITYFFSVSPSKSYTKLFYYLW